MTNNQYSMALTVTYIPYIVAELPSNLLLRVSHQRVSVMFIHLCHLPGCRLKSHAANNAHALGSGDYAPRCADFFLYSDAKFTLLEVLSKAIPAS